MYKENSVAVVVPAYNVAAHILQVLKALPPFVDRIVVVDDCGTDETSKVLTQVNDPRVVIFKHESNKGVGGVMGTGMPRAINHDAIELNKLHRNRQSHLQYLPALLYPF